MSTKPRNPYLLPALAAGLVLGAGASGLLLVAIDDADRAEALDPAIAARIAELRAEREWAGTVCGAVETWRSDLGAATDSVVDGFDVTEPGATWDLATTAFGDARDATNRMIDTIRATPVPDTPAGRALADGVDDLVDHAADHIEEIGLRVAAIGADVGVTDGFNVPGLVDEVQSLVRDARADVDALREPAIAMLDALRANESCAPLLRVLQLD